MAVGAGTSAIPLAGRGGGGVAITVPAPGVPAGCVVVVAGCTGGTMGAAVAAAGRGGAMALSKPCNSFLRVLGETLMPTEPGAGDGAVVTAPGSALGPAVPEF